MDKMTIKEAGRYANFLDGIISGLSDLSWKGINSQIKSVTETHKRKAAHRDLEDEIVEVEFEDDYDITVNELTQLIDNLVREKIELASSIANAKRTVSIEIDGYNTLDLDSAIESAKLLRRFSQEYIQIINTNKDSKHTENRRGYSINVEGNQTTYVYETEVNTTILFDKQKLRDKDKEIKLTADKLSDKIEQTMNEPIVEFTPEYNYLDTIEDIIREYTK